MCGFAGIFDRTGVDQYELENMIQLIYHRGPDQQRIKNIDDKIKIGFARLAIIDLKSGSQPMSNEDDTITIMLNGEIYNYIELKKELLELGINFSTNSDTEVVLKMYEKYGIEAVNRFEGMFGIVVIDKKNEKIFLIRDRFGIKPIYYSYKDSKLGFASEIKPLLKLPFVSKTVDRESVAEFLEFEYVQAPDTIFKDIKKLKPGHYIELSYDNYKEIPYWDCNEIQENSGMSLEQAKERTIELLKESLKLHLRSDVPLGFFLSGGIDSGLLVALACEQVDKIDTYTLNFENGDFDESNLAELVANRYHTNHHRYTVKADDFKKLIAEMSWIFDEPIGDSGILPNYILNELVRNDGTKVIISGAGGDELFAGYTYYFENKKEKYINKYPRIATLLSGALKYAKPELANKINRALLYKKNPCLHMIECERKFTADEIKRLLAVENRGNSKKLEYSEQCKQNNINKMLYVDLKTYLSDNLMLLSDRSCMAFSVEGRVPFLHHPLVEFALSIPEKIKAPNKERKWMLKEIAKEYLPKEIFDAPKMGFCSPIQRWADNGLADFAYNILNSKSAKLREIWVNDEYQNYVSNKENYKKHFDKIYLLLILEIYMRMHIDNTFDSRAEIDMEKIYG